MGGALIGSEAVAAGLLTRGQLRWNYRAIYPDVHLELGSTVDMPTKAQAAWLWSHRRGVITGRAAAALHGAKWIDDAADVELIWSNNHTPKGIVTRRERIDDDEICDLGGLRVATPARTAFDLARFMPRNPAVTHLDALAGATGVNASDVLALTDRYVGARGVKLCRKAVDLMDAGGQSPKETWLRLLLIDAGHARPQTQIPVLDDWGEPFAFLDMGWPDVMIAVEYDGDEHRKNRRRYVWDEKRLRMILRRGWLHVKVIAEDTRADILARVGAAWAQRQREAMAAETLKSRPGTLFRGKN